MTRDDIIRMARECFADPDGSLVLLTPELTQFAALVAAAEREKFKVHAAALVRDARHDATEREREACAKLVEADGRARGVYGYMLTKAAARIRARGDE